MTARDVSVYMRSTTMSCSTKRASVWWITWGITMSSAVASALMNHWKHCSESMVSQLGNGSTVTLSFSARIWSELSHLGNLLLHLQQGSRALQLPGLLPTPVLRWVHPGNVILRLELIRTEIPLQQREAYFYLMFACNVKCQNIRPQLRSISHSNKGKIKIFHVSASLSLVSSEFHDRPALKTLSKHIYIWN